jgi:hypothetical protein
MSPANLLSVSIQVLQHCCDVLCIRNAGMYSPSPGIYSAVQAPHVSEFKLAGIVGVEFAGTLGLLNLQVFRRNI